MVDKEEQEKPLSAVAHRPYRRIEIEQTEAFSGEFMPRRHQKCIIYGGLSAAILLIIAMVILVLMLTVFRVKDPILKMDSLNIKGLNNTTNFGLGRNLSVEADVAIKNPNVASFKFVHATTDLYYRGSIIGETTSLSGQTPAHKTLREKVLIEVVMDKMMEIEGFKSDLGRGIVPISLYMRIHGDVKITNAIKRSVVISMNCTMNVNIRRQVIQDQNCGRRVSL